MLRNQIWLPRDNPASQKQIISCRMSLMILLMARVVMKKAVTITNMHNYSCHYSEPSMLPTKGIEALKKAARSLYAKSQRHYGNQEQGHSAKGLSSVTLGKRHSA